MSFHAYLDESGTMDHQGVMSVAMIILEGANSAQKLHDHVMTALNPKYIQLIKQMKKERKQAKDMPHLHFADMTLDQKCKVGGALANAKVRVYTAHHLHHREKTHQERFEIYTELVKLCIWKAMKDHNTLVITIAKQGGWQKYERDFLAQLRALSEKFTRIRNYRQVSIELRSAIKPGIQLADFYVGAVREYTMDRSTAGPYTFIREQIFTQETYP